MGSEAFKPVQFVKDTSSIDVGEIYTDTYLIYRDGFYDLPDIKGVEYIEFEEFKARYYALNPRKYILVGINRIITPSNRCQMVFDHLQTMTRSVEKVSVDTSPFIGEPWRLWYHYDMTNNDTFNVPHGYAIETEWKYWFYRKVNDCRMSGANIGKHTRDVTRSDLERIVFEAEFYDANDDSWYREIKEHVFSKYKTPKLVINNLLKECNKRYSIKLNYDSYLKKSQVSLPNLKIYQFVTDEINRRVDIYNEVIGQ